MQVGLRVRRHVLPCEVVQKQNGIGRGNLVPCALNANFLYLVNAIAVAQSSGVDDMHGHTFNLNGLLHHIACGASNGCDDGQLCACQGIEQRAFASVGLTCNHHFDAFAQQGTLLCTLAYFGQLRLQTIELSLGIGFLQEVNFFFWKIQCGLDQHAQVNQLVAQNVNLFGEVAGQGSAGASGCSACRGVDQISDGLSLGQIDLVVQKCALCELTRCR